MLSTHWFCALLFVQQDFDHSFHHRNLRSTSILPKPRHLTIMGSDNEALSDPHKSARSAVVSFRNGQQINLLLIVIILIAQLMLIPWLKSSRCPDKATTYFRQDCQKKLDALDMVHDQRKEAKIKEAERVKARLINPETAKDEEYRRRITLFDPFEPDAVCLTEERFGGRTEERHDAFGDGSNFLCGADYLRDSSRKQSESCLVYRYVNDVECDWR